MENALERAVTAMNRAYVNGASDMYQARVAVGEAMSTSDTDVVEAAARGIFNRAYALPATALNEWRIASESVKYLYTQHAIAALDASRKFIEAIRFACAKRSLCDSAL